MSEQHDVRPIKDRILDYIRRTDHVSFAELRNRFGQDFQLEGSELALMAGEFVVFWTGLNETAAKALEELLEAKLIKTQPCQPLIYAMDGGMLGLPILKPKARKPPTKLTWAPVVLRPVQ